MGASFSHPYRNVLIVMLFAVPAWSAQLNVETTGGVTTLWIDANPVFHTTDATVSEDALIELSSPTFLVAHWKETIASTWVTLPGSRRSSAREDEGTCTARA